MGELSTTAKNAALNGIPFVSASLHTAYNAAGGLEVGGGTYARVPITLISTDGNLSLSTMITFNVPGGVTVYWLGLWSGTNQFLGMIPLNSLNSHLFVLDSADLTTFHLGINAALGDGRTVVVWSGMGFFLPRTSNLEHIVEGQPYYVVNATSSSIQLSATLGGAPLVFTSATVGYLQEIMSVTYATDGQLSIFNMNINTLAGP